MGAPAAMFVASMVISYLTRPKMPNTKSEGPKLQELRGSNSNYGAGIPRVWGSMRVGGNIIWAGKVIEHKTTTTTSSGGKGGGGGGSHEQTEYHYTTSFAVGLMDAKFKKLASIKQIMFDGKTVYGGRTPPVNKTVFTVAQKVADRISFRVYDGSEDQLPDSIISSQLGLENTPAFRGMAYIVFDNLNITKYGNRIPQMDFIIETDGERICSEIDWVEFDQGPAVDWYRGLVSGVSGSELLTADLFTGDVLAKRKIDGIYGVTGFSADGSLVARSTTGSPTPAQRWNIGSYNPLTFSAKRIRAFGYTSFFTPHDLALLSNPEHMATGGYTSAMTGSRKTVSVCSYTLDRTFSSLYVSSATVVTGSPSGIFASRGGISISEFYREIPGEAHFITLGITSSKLTVSLMRVYDTYSVGLMGDVTFYPEVKHDILFTLAPQQFNPDLETFNHSSAGWVNLEYSAIDRMVVSGDTITIVAMNNYATQLDLKGNVLWRFDGGKPADQSAFASGWGSWDKGGSIAGVRIPVGGMVDGKAGTHTVNLSSGKSEFFCNYSGKITGSFNGGSSALVESKKVRLLNSFLSSGASMGSIARDLAGEVGIENLDTSDIDNLTASGVAHGDPTEPATLLEMTGIAFDFSIVEQDGKVIFQKKKTQSVATYLIGDLLSRNGENLEVTRKEDTALPEKVEVRFANTAKNFEQDIATAKRFKGSDGWSTAKSAGSFNVNLPIAGDTQELTEIADKVLMSRWNGRTLFKFKLPRSEMFLNVGDIVSVEHGDFFQDMEIFSLSIGGDYTLEVEAVSIFSEQYKSNRKGFDGEGFYDGARRPAVVELLAFNSPYLNDSDDRAWLAISAYTPVLKWVGDWTGAVIQRLANEDDYIHAETVSRDTDWGALESDLPASNLPWVTNWKQELIVRMAVGKLETADYFDVLGGYNRLAIVKDGEAEVISFMQAEFLGEKTYRLKGIVRGQRGTDYLTRSRNITEGASVIVLDGETPRVALNKDLIGTLQNLRAFGTETEPDRFASHADVVFSGAEYKPYAVAQGKVENQGQDLAISWHRRTRISGAIQDGTGIVSLGETIEAYEVDVVFNGEVVRTLESQVEEVTYSQGQRLEDGTGGTGVSLKFEIYQLSGLVGRGFKSEIEYQGLSVRIAENGLMLATHEEPYNQIELAGTLAMYKPETEFSTSFGGNLLIGNDRQLNASFGGNLLIGNDRQLNASFGGNLIFIQEDV